MAAPQQREGGGWLRIRKVYTVWRPRSGCIYCCCSCFKRYATAFAVKHSAVSNPLFALFAACCLCKPARRLVKCGFDAQGLWMTRRKCVDTPPVKIVFWDLEQVCPSKKTGSVPHLELQLVPPRPAQVVHLGSLPAIVRLQRRIGVSRPIEIINRALRVDISAR